MNEKEYDRYIRRKVTRDTIFIILGIGVVVGLVYFVHMVLTT
jgi:hypothetical protein